MAFVVLGVHELGHLIAGLVQGFRFELFVVGPLGIRREEEKTLKEQNVEAQEAILEYERQLAEKEERQKREIANIKARENAEITKINEEERLRSEMVRIHTEEELSIAEENKLRQVIVAAKNKEKTEAIENERVENSLRSTPSSPGRQQNNDFEFEFELSPEDFLPFNFQARPPLGSIANRAQELESRTFPGFNNNQGKENHPPNNVDE